jgi:hypothetical protein
LYFRNNAISFSLFIYFRAFFLKEQYERFTTIAERAVGWVETVEAFLPPLPPHVYVVWYCAWSVGHEVLSKLDCCD